MKLYPVNNSIGVHEGMRLEKGKESEFIKWVMLWPTVTGAELREEGVFVTQEDGDDYLYPNKPFLVRYGEWGVLGLDATAMSNEAVNTDFRRTPWG